MLYKFSFLQIQSIAVLSVVQFIYKLIVD